MALMSKNKPTKTITFENGEVFVELQHLSKGVKDQIQSRLAGLYKDLEKINVKKESNGELEDLPDGLDLDDVLNKINEVEYYKLSKAIKSWSEKEVAITEESVKELDDEVFAVISKDINEMNSLGQVERKN